MSEDNATTERTIDIIEKEMEDLHSKKELAYLDYRDNSGGDDFIRERLWAGFEHYRNRWNELVKEHLALQAKEGGGMRSAI